MTWRPSVSLLVMGVSCAKMVLLIFSGLLAYAKTGEDYQRAAPAKERSPCGLVRIAVTGTIDEPGLLCPVRLPPPPKNGPRSKRGPFVFPMTCIKTAVSPNNERSSTAGGRGALRSVGLP